MAAETRAARKKPSPPRKRRRDAEQRKALEKALKDYQKRWPDTIATETRALLKERFPYPIFLYEAERVRDHGNG